MIHGTEDIKNRRLFKRAIKRVAYIMRDTRRYINKKIGSGDDIDAVITLLRVLYAIRNYLMFWGLCYRQGLLPPTMSLSAIDSLCTMVKQACLTRESTANYLRNNLAFTLGGLAKDARYVMKELRISEVNLSNLSSLDRSQLYRSRSMWRVTDFGLKDSLYEIPIFPDWKGLRDKHGYQISEVTENDGHYKYSRILDNKLVEAYATVRERFELLINNVCGMDDWTEHVKLIAQSIDGTYEAVLRREHDYDAKCRNKQTEGETEAEDGGDAGTESIGDTQDVPGIGAEEPEVVATA
jgi:hypothetical protein